MEAEKEKRNLISTRSYYYLKWFAMIAMIISNGAYFFHEQQHWNSLLYFCIRSIGQFCIPIFCYLIVQCFHYTEHKLKHCLKILTIALVSEIPYDIFTTIKFISTNHQNSCFSLCLGFFMLYAINVLVYKVSDYVNKNAPYLWLAKGVILVLKINAVVFSFFIAILMKTEYSINILLLILMLEIAEKSSHKKLGQLLAFVLYILSTLNVVSVISLIDLAFIWIAQNRYKKQQLLAEDTEDKKAEIQVSGFMKKLSTVFYPLHLLLLIALRMYITLAL